MPPHACDEAECWCSLMEVMMAFIDIVGSYEMPARAREKAERARAEAAKLQEKERRKELAESVQKKKLARRVPPSLRAACCVPAVCVCAA